MNELLPFEDNMEIRKGWRTSRWTDSTTKQARKEVDTLRKGQATLRKRQHFLSYSLLPTVPPSLPLHPESQANNTNDCISPVSTLHSPWTSSKALYSAPSPSGNHTRHLSA